MITVRRSDIDWVSLAEATAYGTTLAIAKSAAGRDEPCPYDGAISFAENYG